MIHGKLIEFWTVSVQDSGRCVIVFHPKVIFKSLKYRSHVLAFTNFHKFIQHSSKTTTLHVIVIKFRKYPNSVSKESF